MKAFFVLSAMIIGGYSCANAWQLGPIKGDDPHIPPPRVEIPNSGEVLRAVPIVGDVLKKNDCDKKNRDLDNAYKDDQLKYAVAETNLKALRAQQVSLEQAHLELEENQKNQITLLEETKGLAQNAKSLALKIEELRGQIELQEPPDRGMLAEFASLYSMLRQSLPQKTQLKMDVLIGSLNSDASAQDQRLQNLKVALQASGIVNEVQGFAQDLLINVVKLELITQATANSIQANEASSAEVSKNVNDTQTQLNSLRTAMQANRGQKC